MYGVRRIKCKNKCSIQHISKSSIHTYTICSTTLIIYIRVSCVCKPYHNLSFSPVCPMPEILSHEHTDLIQRREEVHNSYICVCVYICGYSIK